MAENKLAVIESMTDKSPNTGDNSRVGLCFVLFALSAATLITVARKKA